MTKKTLTVLLIEDNPEFAQLVQRWLSLREDVTFILNWTDSLMAGINRISQGGVDVVLLDLGLPDSDGMDTFTTLRIHADGVPIVLLTGSDSEDLSLQMVLQGAQDFLIKSSCNGDTLAKSIQYAIVRFQGTNGNQAAVHKAEACRVIGVLGCKGGVGTTTVACNLALELSRQTGQPTLLADMDMDGGMVGFMTNAEGEYSFKDAVDNLSRLDSSCWEGIVARGADGLQVVRSPSLLGAGVVDAGKARHVITLVRNYYRWIVLDLGRLNSFSTTILDRVNELYLVATPCVPEFYESRRTIAALKKAGIEGDRLRIVLNQYEKSSAYSESELHQVFENPIFGVLPEAARELNDGCAQGKCLGENSVFRASVASVARKVAGLAPEKAKKHGSNLFSFKEKFRKVEAGVSGG